LSEIYGVNPVAFMFPLKSPNGEPELDYQADETPYTIRSMNKGGLRLPFPMGGEKTAH